MGSGDDMTATEHVVFAALLLLPALGELWDLVRGRRLRTAHAVHLFAALLTLPVVAYSIHRGFTEPATLVLLLLNLSLRAAMVGYRFGVTRRTTDAAEPVRSAPAERIGSLPSTLGS